MISAEPVANFRLAFLLDLFSFPRAIFVVSNESLLLRPHTSRHMLKSDVSMTAMELHAHTNIFVSTINFDFLRHLTLYP